MSKRPVFTVIVLLTFWFHYCDANSDIFDLGSPYFETVGSEEDIPLGVITALAQDKQGFLWIGSQQGLIRYDGYRFQKYKHKTNDPNSLSGDFIITLFVDSNGLLWIGTAGNGVSVFNNDNQTFQRYEHLPEQENSLSHNRVLKILEDPAGNMWIATHNGLNLLNKNSQSFVHFFHSSKPNSLNSNKIGSLLLENDRSLLVGTWNGVNRVSLDDKTISSVFSTENQSINLNAKTVDYLFKDSQETLWFGTKTDGVFFSLNGVDLQHIATDPTNPSTLHHPWVHNIIEIHNKQSNNEIWLGSFGEGITVIDQTTKKVITHHKFDASVPSSLNQNFIGAQLVDDSGILWVGTWGGGLNRYNPKNNAFKTLRPSSTNPNSISDSAIISILELKNGHFWLGTRQKGIDVIDPKIGVIQHFLPDPSNPDALGGSTITHLSESNDGLIWISTALSGLYVYSPVTKKFRRYTQEDGLTNNAVWRTLPNDNQTVWVATDTGLHLLDQKTGRLTFYNKLYQSDEKYSGRINNLVKTSDNTLWLSSSNGLLRLDGESNTLIRYAHDSQRSDSLSHNVVNGLMVDKNDQLWIANARSIDRLISYDNQKATFESLNQVLELPNVTFWSNLMMDENGRLWDGQNVFDLKNETHRSLSKSDAVDIGVNWYGAYYKTSKGTLLYGGKGLLMIKPHLFSEWTYQPNLAITALNIDDTVVSQSTIETLHISPENKRLSVEFSSLDLSAPEKNQYRYQLIGYDEQWKSPQQNYRLAQYTNLDPGTYELVIQGSNKAGVFSEKQLTIPIIVIPAWYQTFWFNALVFIAFLSLIYLLYKMRISHLHAKKRELMLEVKARTSEIEILSEMGKELSASLEAEDIFNQLHRHISELFDVYIFAIGLIEFNEKKIAFQFLLKDGKKLDPIERSISNDQTLISQCISSEKEVIIQDVTNYLNYDYQKESFCVNAQINSYLYLPIKNKYKSIIGCVVLQSLYKNAFDEQHIEIIRTLTSYTSIALDNALAYHQIEYQKQEVEDKNKQIQSAYQSLEELSVTDDLTKLRNRRFLINHLENDLNRSIRVYTDWAQGKKNSLPENSDHIFFMLDLDHFKSVNDTYGHTAGDTILIEIKSILEFVFRETDYFVRWGGEEFLIITRFSNRLHASSLAERLRNTVETHAFVVSETTTLNKTCSVGFAAFPLVTHQPNKISWLQTIDLVDQCLYFAKRNRNCWVGAEVQKSIDAEQLIDSFNKNENIETLVESGMIKLIK